jgi:hypothetical protein
MSNSIFFDKIEVFGLIKISPKYENKLDIQSGVGSKLGSVVFQGTNLGEFSLTIEVGLDMYDELEQFTYEEQNARMLKAIALLKAGKPVTVKHPEFTILNVKQIAMKSVSCDDTGTTKVYSLDLVEYVPRKNVKPQQQKPETSETSADEQRLARGISQLADP